MNLSSQLPGPALAHPAAVVNPLVSGLQSDEMTVLDGTKGPE
jgi:hypothetical protein